MSARTPGCSGPSFPAGSRESRRHRPAVHLGRERNLDLAGVVRGRLPKGASRRNQVRGGSEIVHVREEPSTARPPHRPSRRGRRQRRASPVHLATTARSRVIVAMTPLRDPKPHPPDDSGHGRQWQQRLGRAAARSVRAAGPREGLREGSCDPGEGGDRPAPSEGRSRAARPCSRHVPPGSGPPVETPVE